MPKMRSHSGTKKRFRLSGTGKVMYKKPGNNHLAPGKTQKRVRHMRKEDSVCAADMKRIKRQIANI